MRLTNDPDIEDSYTTYGIPRRCGKSFVNLAWKGINQINGESVTKRLSWRGTVGRGWNQGRGAATRRRILEAFKLGNGRGYDIRASCDGSHNQRGRCLESRWKSKVEKWFHHRLRITCHSQF